MKVCLDAGHFGKYNRSPAVPSYYESEVMWKLHLLYKKYFKDYGIDVITTRNSQSADLALISRGKKAAGCDLFLSLHSNAVGSRVDEDVDHIVVARLIDDDTTDIDEKSKSLAEVIAPVVTKIMGVSQKNYRIVANKSTSDRNGDGKYNDNYYGVLHGARMANVPGLIIEHGFHTNTKTTLWLLDESNLERLAKGVVDTIAKHYGITSSTTVYRVQVGAYTKATNAENMKNKLTQAGYKPFVAKVDGYYKVQVGSYVLHSNAVKLVNELKDKGFTAIIKKATV